MESGKDIVSTVASYALIEFLQKQELPDLMEIFNIVIADVAGEAISKSELGKKLLKFIPELFPEIVSLRELAAINLASAVLQALIGKKISQQTIMKLTGAKVIGSLLEKVI